MYNKRTNNRSSVDKQNATDTEGNSNRPLSKMVAEQMFVNDTHTPLRHRSGRRHFFAKRDRSTYFRQYFFLVRRAPNPFRIRGTRHGDTVSVGNYRKMEREGEARKEGEGHAVFLVN